MPPVAIQLSYRLGGSDGVGVEARKWEWALGELGFEVRRVAGELDDGRRDDDIELPFLAIAPDDDAVSQPDALAAALRGADLVVVENLCSLPINPVAASLAATVLHDHDGRVVFHHHDLPWQRAGLPTPKNIPPRRPNSLHVTINDHSRVQLENRGFDAITLRNAFDLEPVLGDRDSTREAFGFASVEVLHRGAFELQLREQLLLAGLAQVLNQLAVEIEVILDGRLPRAGHEQHLFHAHPGQFLHDVLDNRLAADREHLLGLRLGGRQEAGAEAGHGNDGNGD
jgi:hypothetical protein